MSAISRRGFLASLLVAPVALRAVTDTAPIQQLDYGASVEFSQLLKRTYDPSFLAAFEQYQPRVLFPWGISDDGTIPSAIHRQVHQRFQDGVRVQNRHDERRGRYRVRP